MTTQEKLIRRKQSLLGLAEYPQNLSQTCWIQDVSQKYFYDIKTAYAELGIEGFEEKSHRKPCLEIRVPLEGEEAGIQMAH